MKALLRIFSITFLMSFVLIGCVTETSGGNKIDTRNEGIQEIVDTDEDFQAIVVNKDETSVTVSKSGLNEKVKRIYTLATTKIDYVAEVGDKVKVWTTGQYEESNPIQGKAIKIEIIN
ncbi:DUF3221 domain-containing protein [Paenibacillus sp. Marseille-Q7038]